MSRTCSRAGMLTLASLLIAGRTLCAQVATPPGAPTAKSDVAQQKAPETEAALQERLEKEFAEMMTGATLCGQFTTGSLTAVPCKDEKASGDKPAGVGKSGQQDADQGSEKKAPADSEKRAPADGAAKPLKEDRYTLGRVQKLQGDNWLIEARIQYGGHDVTVPLPLQVKWAGDTPVITLTDLGVPGLGVFTSRVLFYRGQYAGTWRHGDHGGELFGRVTPAKK